MRQACTLRFTQNIVSALLSVLVLILTFSFWANAYAKAPEPINKHNPQVNPSTNPSYKPLAFKILQTKEHATKAFTQGWIIEDGKFYESSGLYGKSYLVRYNRDNHVEQTHTLPKHLFAEGLTLLNNELYLLSWQKGKAFVFDPATFQLKRSHNYQGEGWGLTHNGTQLIMSNGTNQLYLRDAQTFRITHTITVKGESYHWDRLNELEFAKNAIWANIWQTSLIIAINPNTGMVMGTVNLDKLVKANTTQPAHQSLNGIAYDAKLDAFWVTGKHWTKRYLIQIQTPAGLN